MTTPGGGRGKGKGAVRKSIHLKSRLPENQKRAPGRGFIKGNVTTHCNKAGKLRTYSQYGRPQRQKKTEHLKQKKKTKRKSSVTRNASERSTNKSLHVFTGAKRVRGTTSACEPGSDAMAAPIAVSSWNTGVDDPSRGSTVLELRISGNGRTPPDGER